MSKSIFLFNLLICFFVSGVASASEPDVDDRPVALITGSSYGLGAELTQLAVARGWRVALVDVRPAPSILKVEEIRASGGIATFYEVDLAVPAKRAGLVSQVVDEFGRIDYLFNNAGYAYLATLEEMDMAAAHHLFEVNYWAYADLAQRNAHAANAAFEVVEADLTALPSDLRQQSFDHVIANPPYDRAGGGAKAGDAGREKALREDTPRAE